MTAARALQKLRDGLASSVAAIDELLSGPDPAEWIDQTRSPLGRRKHCRLARTGKLVGARKDGRQWLVKRRDLDVYLSAADGAGEDASEAEVLAFRSKPRRRGAK